MPGGCNNSSTLLQFRAIFVSFATVLHVCLMSLFQSLSLVEILP